MEKKEEEKEKIILKRNGGEISMLNGIEEILNGCSRRVGERANEHL